MSAGAWMMLIAIVITVATLTLLMAALVRSIHDERSKNRGIWREFALGLVLMILFFTTWVAHAITEWQVFTDQQAAQGQAAKVGDFASEFASSTLENWQSEFLQLFTFVVLAALYIHKGSGESKDGTEKIEASLRRIEQHLGTLPPMGEQEPGTEWKLPDTPLESEDVAHRPLARSV